MDRRTITARPNAYVLSMSFIAAVVGKSVTKGLIAAGLGMLVAFIGTGEDFYPRLTGGAPFLASGFPVAAAVLGVLVIGEVIKGIEDLARERAAPGAIRQIVDSGDNRLTGRERRRLLPFIANSAAIGTAVGALPGVGSTLAATLGYTSGRRMQERRGGTAFGTGLRPRARASPRPSRRTACASPPVRPSSPDCCRSLTGSTTTASTSTRRRARRASPTPWPRRATTPRSSARRTSRPITPSGPPAPPESLISSADYGPDWHGPYMGFAHVEIMLVGHNWFPPEVPPRGQHYECWFHADGRGAEKMEAYRRNAPTTATGRATTASSSRDRCTTRACCACP